jgi:hypothetical protein
MQLNWGTGIALAYTAFVGLMVFAVVSATKSDPGLLRKDYYQLDLDYQEHMDKKVNAAGLSADPVVRFDAGSRQLKVQWPPNAPFREGRVNMYRLSDDRAELRAAFPAPVDGVSSLAADKLASGRWHVELDWTDTDGKAYFTTTKINLQQP